MHRLNGSFIDCTTRLVWLPPENSSRRKLLAELCTSCSHSIPCHFSLMSIFSECSQLRVSGLLVQFLDKAHRFLEELFIGCVTNVGYIESCMAVVWQCVWMIVPSLEKAFWNSSKCWISVATTVANFVLLVVCTWVLCHTVRPVYWHLTKGWILILISCSVGGTGIKILAWSLKSHNCWKQLLVEFGIGTKRRLVYLVDDMDWPCPFKIMTCCIQVSSRKSLLLYHQSLRAMKCVSQTFGYLLFIIFTIDLRTGTCMTWCVAFYRSFVCTLWPFCERSS